MNGHKRQYLLLNLDRMTPKLIQSPPENTCLHKEQCKDYYEIGTAILKIQLLQHAHGAGPVMVQDKG